MLLSVYSVCMAVLFSTGVIYLLRIIFHTPKFAYRFHPDFFSVSIWLFYFRFFIPCSFLIGIELPWDKFFADLDDRLNAYSFLSITGYGWLSWIWLAGAVIAYIRYRMMLNRNNALRELMLADAVEYKIKDFIPDYAGPDYKVFISPNVDCSFVMGKSEYIILPPFKMTSQEIESILLHEACHLFNEDGIYLILYAWLKIVYWWFIPVYFFRSILDLFYEIRVDLTVNQMRSPQQRIDYSKALLKFSSPSSKHIRFVPQPLGFSALRQEPIEARIRFLLNSTFEEPYKTSTRMLLIPFIAAFVSAFILISELALF